MYLNYLPCKLHLHGGREGVNSISHKQSGRGRNLTCWPGRAGPGDAAPALLASKPPPAHRPPHRYFCEVFKRDATLTARPEVTLKGERHGAPCLGTLLAAFGRPRGQSTLVGSHWCAAGPARTPGSCLELGRRRRREGAQGRGALTAIKPGCFGLLVHPQHLPAISTSHLQSHRTGPPASRPIPNPHPYHEGALRLPCAAAPGGCRSLPR